MVRPVQPKTIGRKSVWVLVLMLILCVPIISAYAADDDDMIVTAIEIEHTQYLSESEMLEVMTETVVGESFDADKLMADLQAINDLSLSRYNEPVFFDFEAELVPYADGVKVVVYPIEMPEVRIDIDVIDEDVFLEHFSLETADLVDNERFNMALGQAVDSVFNETGHFFTPTFIDLDDDNVLNITLRAVRVGSIEAVGNEKTRDYVIEREIRTQVGEPLNVHMVNDDLRRLAHLGFFNEESIGADLSERATDPLKVDIVYHLEEIKTGMAGFGAGYSSNEGLVGYLELADDNLFGRGQHAGIRAEFGGTKRSYDLNFHEPNLRGSGVSLGFSLYNRLLETIDRDQNEYTQNDVGGNLTLGKRLTDFLQASVRLRVTDTVSTFDDDNIPTSENRTRSIQLNLLGDTTNRPNYPTEGVRYRVSTEFGRPIWGGTTKFDKYRAEWSTYRQVGSNDQVLAGRLIGGYSPHMLPDEEVFRVGGPDTVRSYNYGAMQGENMFVGNTEYRFKISDTVQGVVFADVGNAWAADEVIKLHDVKTALGLGVRFDTPFGMMRLDYGFGNDGGRLFFSLGPSF